MIQPASILFRVIKGTTFTYAFQYLLSTPETSTPVNLAGYSATWSINWTAPSTGQTLYTVQNGVAANTSGIYFGGPTNDKTTGIITLVIGSADTQSIPWSTAIHQFGITDTAGATQVLFNGGIGVTGMFP